MIFHTIMKKRSKARNKEHVTINTMDQFLRQMKKETKSAEKVQTQRTWYVFAKFELEK